MGQRLPFGLFTVLLLAGPVFGHAKLLGMVPAADAQLSSAPHFLTLTFNEPVRLAVLKISAAEHDVR